MIYNRLGSSGVKVSALGFGAPVRIAWDVPKAKELMGAAFHAGCNFFDGAETYAGGQSEIVMGQAIKELGWKRSDIVLSTKIFWGGSGPNDCGLSRKHIIEGTKASLKRLDQEYVDLIFAHRHDHLTSIEETVRAFNWIIDQGLAFYWGTSEWSAQQITEAWDVANRLDLIGPTMEQPEYNLFSRKKVEQEFQPVYERYGLGLTTWSPLAFGLLSGKYSKGHVPEGSRLSSERYTDMAKMSLQDEKLAKVEALKPIAAELGCSLAQLSLAWAASNPRVSSVITGATSAQQIEDNMRALRFVEQIDSVRERIEAVMQNKPEAELKWR